MVESSGAKGGGSPIGAPIGGGCAPPGNPMPGLGHYNAGLTSSGLGKKRTAKGAGFSQDNALGEDGNGLDIGDLSGADGACTGLEGPPEMSDEDYNEAINDWVYEGTGGDDGSPHRAGSDYLTIDQLKHIMKIQSRALLQIATKSFQTMLQQHEANMQQLLDNTFNNVTQHIQHGGGMTPMNHHDLESLKLKDIQESSKTLILYGFPNESTPEQRHADVKEILADYPKLHDHDYKPKYSDEDHLGYNVINGQDNVSQYLIDFKSVGARKHAQAFIQNKKKAIRARTRQPICQETIDQTLLTVRNKSQAQNLNIVFQTRRDGLAGPAIYHQDGSDYAYWGWENAYVCNPDGSYFHQPFIEDSSNSNNKKK